MGLKVVQARVADLRCYERNPRRISLKRLEALKRSLAEDREMLLARPLIALADGRVICGNQRLLAAQQLGWRTIATAYVELDEARARTWVLRDNNGYGEWDDTLPAFLAELARDGVHLELTGFSPEDIDRFIREASRSRRDPDEAPPLPAKPKSKPGKVYELGPHRLMCGDSSDPDVMHLLLGGGVAEVLWTDPPYGVSYVGKTKQALTIEGDNRAGLRPFLAAAFAAVDSVLAPGGRFYCAAPAGPRHLDFLLAIEDAGWNVHETLVWVKDVFVLGHSDYHYRHEPIIYGWKPGPGRAGRGKHDGTRWYGDHAQDTVFEVPRPTRSEEHPTMKPVELIAQQLANSTQRSDVVLDAFAGSGSTMIAAEQLGRRCFAMEIDPRYVDVCRQRYANFTGQPEYAP